MKTLVTLVIGTLWLAWVPAQAAAQQAADATPVVATSEPARPAPALARANASALARLVAAPLGPHPGEGALARAAQAPPPLLQPVFDAAGADSAAPVLLTLDAAIARALDASHRLGELRAREDGARAALQGRQAAELPQLSAQAGYTRTNHVTPFGVGLPGRPSEIIYPDIPDNYRTRLDAQWPIYTFGRTAALERLAQAELEASGKDVEAARADLRLEVTRAFWALVTADEAVRVFDESLKRMDAALQDVQNRQKVGLVPPSDVLSMQAQRSRQQMLLIQSRNQSDVSRADLARLVGLPADGAIAPQAALDQPLPPPVDVGPLVAEARQARPERQALMKRVAEAGERQAIAHANQWPTLAASGGVDLARPNPRIFPRTAEWQGSWDASVNVNYVFWDGGRARADVAQTTADQRAAVERLADFDRMLDVEVRQRWLDTQSSRAAVNAALDSVKAAAEARRVVEERFAAGVATTTDVLDAQVALLQAELDRTQALANVRLADARLSRAIGR